MDQREEYCVRIKHYMWKFTQSHVNLYINFIKRLKCMSAHEL